MQSQPLLQILSFAAAPNAWHRAQAMLPTRTRMKSTLTIACALLLCTSASAQSTVRLSGVVDQYVAYSRSGGTSMWQLKDGGAAASRLVFSGEEDLGGGLRANFMMEGGFNADSGTGTLPGPAFGFTRQTFLGLGGKWGRVDAGRMYTPFYYSVARADAFGNNGIFSLLNLLLVSDAQTGIGPYAARASNMVRYRAPAGPLLFDIGVAPGEAATPNTKSGNFYGMNVGYATGPFYISYGYQNIKQGTAVAPVPQPKSSTYQAINASYRFTPDLAIYGNHIRTRSQLATVPDGAVTNISMAWSFGANKLMAGVAFRDVDGTTRDQKGFNLGYDYNLSKRTAVYGRFVRLINDSNSAASIAGVTVAPNSGADISHLGFGIKHSF